MNPKERIRPIAWLADQVDYAYDVKDTLKHEVAASRIHNNDGIVPTIGCEVEVSWLAKYPSLLATHFNNLDPNKKYTLISSMVDDLSSDDRAAFEADKLRKEAADIARYKATTKAGIPRGLDGFWEFANAPAYSWQTLASELDLLMDADYIPVGPAHSLHVTLGGVAIEGGGPHLIMGGLELLTVPSKRIRAATELDAHSWARRSNRHNGGVGGRPKSTIQLQQSDAIEFRTLITRNHQDHRTLLQSSQILGTILQARRASQNGTASSKTEAIAENWITYRSAFKQLLQERGLPDEGSWGLPFAEPQPWLTWADSLDRRDDTNSIEYETICRINEIVTQTETLIFE